MALPLKAKLLGSALLAAAVGALLYLDRPASEAPTQSTDDAYVQADTTLLAPQVAGTVKDVLVDENQPVEAGELVATLDDRDFAVALGQARAQVASAQAGVEGLKARVLQHAATIRQSMAAVAADAAALELARANAARYRNLAADGSGTVQAQEQAQAQLRIQLATLDRSQAGLQAAREQSAVLKADLDKAEAVLAQALNARSAAELKLSYTRIVAPISGTVAQKSVRVGAFVAPGKPLLAIVPLDAIYVSANFRETQLARVAAGQAVDIDVDALPGERLRGTVESLGAASGVSFAPVPPHNATGNFTKIVQRLPVRIHIEPGQPAAHRLRVGMSVRPTIHIAAAVERRGGAGSH